MVIFGNSLHLSHLAPARTLPRQFAQYGTVSVMDDIFTTFHRNQSRSRLHRIETGISGLKPTWKVPVDEAGKIQNVKIASVLVPLCFSNKEPSVLLTLRSSKLQGHRGQVRYVFTTSLCIVRSYNRMNLYAKLYSTSAFYHQLKSTRVIAPTMKRWQ